MNAQIELKKHTRKVFESRRRRQGITLAFPFWSPTSWWPKGVSKEEYGKWATNMEFEGKFCEECMLRMHARTSIQKKAEFWAKQPLELIHTDICGPINPESFSEKRYFISFIDDYSQKTWAYFLKGNLRYSRCLKSSK